jgi:hypothetical protein
VEKKSNHLEIMFFHGKNNGSLKNVASTVNVMENGMMNSY